MLMSWGYCGYSKAQCVKKMVMNLKRQKMRSLKMGAKRNFEHKGGNFTIK